MSGLTPEQTDELVRRIAHMEEQHRQRAKADRRWALEAVDVHSGDVVRERAAGHQLVAFELAAIRHRVASFRAITMAHEQAKKEPDHG